MTTEKWKTLRSLLEDDVYKGENAWTFDPSFNAQALGKLQAYSHILNEMRVMDGEPPRPIPQGHRNVEDEIPVCEIDEVLGEYTIGVDLADGDDLMSAVLQHVGRAGQNIKPLAVIYKRGEDDEEVSEDNTIEGDGRSAG